MNPESGARTVAGQPVGAMTEFGYVTQDIDVTAERWSRVLNIGPWVKFSPLPTISATYRGAPTTAQIAAAFAYSGNMYFELLQPLDKSPSIVTETLANDTEVTATFHHWARIASDYDSEIAQLEASGYPLAYSGVLPDLDHVRFSYFDCGSKIGGMLEIVEYQPAVESFLNSLRAEARDWGRKTVFVSI